MRNKTIRKWWRELFKELSHNDRRKQMRYVRKTNKY